MVQILRGRLGTPSRTLKRLVRRRWLPIAVAGGLAVVAAAIVGIVGPLPGQGGLFGADVGITASTNLSFLQGLTVASSTGGTVVSDPAGISCGSTCQHSFATGTTVVLTASSAGGPFKGWEGACAGSGITCTLTMNEAKSTKALFGYRLRSYAGGTPGT